MHSLKRFGALFFLALMLTPTIFVPSEPLAAQAIGDVPDYHPDPRYWQLNGTKIEYYLRGEANSVEDGDPKSASLDLKFAADISDVFENILKVRSTTTVIKASSDRYPPGSSETNEATDQKAGESLTSEDFYITSASITEPSDLQVTSLPTIILLYLDSVPAAGTKSISAEELGFSGATGSQTITVTLNYKLTLPQPPYEALSKPPVLDTVRIASTLDAAKSSQEYCAATKETTTVTEKLHVDQEVYVEMNTGLLVYYKDARAGKATSSCSEYNVDKSHLLAYSLTSWNVELISSLRVTSVSQGLKVDASTTGSIFKRGDKTQIPTITVQVSKDLESLINLKKARLEVDILKPSGLTVLPNDPLTYSPLKNITKTVKGTDGWIATWDWTGNWDGNDPKQVQSLPPDEIPVGIYLAVARIINATDNRPIAVSGEVKHYPGGATGARPIYVIFDYSQDTESFIREPNSYELYHYPSHSQLGYGKRAYVLHQFEPRILEDALRYVSFQEILNRQSGLRHPALKASDAVTDITSPYMRGTLIPTYEKSWQIKEGWTVWQTAWWYDTLKALNQKTGVCSDFVGVEVAYLRALGIPARTISFSGKAITDGEERLWRHAAVEAWYSGHWNYYDPTHVVNTPDNYLVTRFAQSTAIEDFDTVQFFPLKGYVGSSLEGEETAGYWALSYDKADGSSVVNLYNRYSYLVDFSKAIGSMSGSDKYDFTLSIRNSGLIDIPSNANLTLNVYFEAKRSSLIWGVSYAPVKERSISLGALKAGETKEEKLEYNVKDLLSKDYWYAYFQVTYESRGKNITLVTTPSSRIYIAYIKPLNSPTAYAASPTPAPQLTVNGESKLLQNFTSSITEDKGGRTRMTGTLSLDSNIVKAVSETSPKMPYVKTAFAISNTGEQPQNTALTLPITGYGDTVYTASTVSITGTKDSINSQTNYIVFYSSNEGVGGRVSVFTSPEQFKLVSISSTTIDNTETKTAYIEWNTSIQPNEEDTFTLYYSDNQKGGTDGKALFTQLAKQVVENGDSMLDINITMPPVLKTASQSTIKVEVQNRGVVDENLDYTLTVSKRLGQSENYVFNILNKTGNVQVSPDAPVTLPFELTTPKTAQSDQFNVMLETKSRDIYRAVAHIESPLSVTAPETITANTGREAKITTTLKNTGETTIHNITVTVNPYQNFKLGMDSSKRIDELEPGSQMDISWTVTPTTSGNLPFQIEAASDDGGTTSTLIDVTALRPVKLEVASNLIQVNSLKLGESRSESIIFNVTNQGASPAKNVVVNLDAPAGVAGEPAKWEIQTLGAGETRTLNTKITFRNETGTAIGITVEEESGETSSGIIVIQTGEKSSTTSTTKTQTTSTTITTPTITTTKSTTSITSTVTTTTTTQPEATPDPTLYAAIALATIVVIGIIYAARRRSNRPPKAQIAPPPPPASQTQTQPQRQPIPPTIQPQSRPQAAKTRFCSNCGSSLTAEQIFCTNCGAQVNN